VIALGPYLGKIELGLIMVILCFNMLFFVTGPFL
jgi:hypothetical protein